MNRDLMTQVIAFDEEICEREKVVVERKLKYITAHMQTSNQIEFPLEY